MITAVESVARARIARARGEIMRSLRHAVNGNPLGAEVDGNRLRARLRRKAKLDAVEADAISCRIETEAKVVDRDQNADAAEAAWLSGAALRAAAGA